MERQGAGAAWPGRRAGRAPHELRKQHGTARRRRGRGVQHDQGQRGVWRRRAGVRRRGRRAGVRARRREPGHGRPGRRRGRGRGGRRRGTTDHAAGPARAPLAVAHLRADAAGWLRRPFGRAQLAWGPVLGNPRARRLQPERAWPNQAQRVAHEAYAAGKCEGVPLAAWGLLSPHGKVGASGSSDPLSRAGGASSSKAHWAAPAAAGDRVGVMQARVAAAPPGSG